MTTLQVGTSVPSAHIAALLGQHAEATAELVDALTERGTVVSAQQRARVEAWLQLDHMNVTERRESVRSATVDFDADISRLDSEIDATRANLRHIELLLHHSAHSLNGSH